MYITGKVIKSINEQLNSLDDIKNMGYTILTDEIVVENEIANILNEKKLTPADLSKMSGISRQNINAVMRGKMKPGIDFALKIATVLDKKVEDIFKLTENAWVQPVKNTEESTLYIDMVEMQVLDGKTRRANVANDGYEYYDTEAKQLLTEKEYAQIIEEYIFDKIEFAEQDVIDEMEDNGNKLSDKVIESLAKKKLISEFEKTHIKRYMKLGKEIKPLINLSNK